MEWIDFANALFRGIQPHLAPLHFELSSFSGANLFTALEWETEGSGDQWRLRVLHETLPSVVNISFGRNDWPAQRYRSVISLSDKSVQAALMASTGPRFYDVDDFDKMQLKASRIGELVAHAIGPYARGERELTPLS